MWRTLRTLSIALALLSSSALVLAEHQPIRVGSIAVSYRDLDLRKPADAQVLLTRLEHAAKTACGGNPKWHFTYESMPKRTTAVFGECRRQAIARAVAEIGAPLLSHAFQQEVAPPSG